MDVEQIAFSTEELRHWPLLVPHPSRQAILTLDDAVLREQHGIQLQDGPFEKGLGPTRVAGIPLPSGQRAPADRVGRSPAAARCRSS